MLRLSLCCKFSEQPIKFRTTTARNLKNLQAKGIDPLAFLSTLILDNIQSLEKALLYCASNHIGAFRIGSDFFPSYTHPDCGYNIDALPDAQLIYEKFAHIRKLKEEKGIRLSFHPDQFVVINSPRPEVVQNSLEELEYHGIAAALTGADVINIHAGGGYGDKPAALKRFSTAFKQLSDAVQTKLTIENDDVTYTPEDLLPICKQLHIPLVYDVHHHRCNPDNLTVEEATSQALKTWRKEPLFHISSPKGGWSSSKPKHHADFIDIKDFPLCWRSIPNLTLDIEAKEKEVAILQLYQDLKNIGWPIK
ncbi:MAG: UV DNA damage repair endonuclease UvsE [Simkaniaceae bacterium]|nr:UV DNA damage repair endonuclease UvsE [Simkaniaceae bacterium]